MVRDSIGRQIPVVLGWVALLVVSGWTVVSLAAPAGEGAPSHVTGIRASGSTVYPNWTQLTTNASLTARAEVAMADDPSDGYVVMFGGHNGPTLSSQTWTFKAGVWTQLHPKYYPSARRGAVMTYDAADGYLILFGGSDRTHFLNDTWKFHAGRWTNITSSVAPSARRVASLTYDAADAYPVLFGGHGGPSVSKFWLYIFYNDTWKFHAGAWTQLATTVAPQKRAESMMAYDANTKVVVLYGGYRGSLTFSDTWSFSAGKWAMDKTPVRPPARDGGGFEYDPSVHGLVLYGGHALTTVRNDTWQLVNGTWTNATPAHSLTAGGGGGYAYASADGVLVAFGGRPVEMPAKFSSETWVRA